MLAALPVFAKTPAVTSFTVTPGMVCENCENKIKSNLRFEKGVKSVETSLSDQTVTVGYDADKTSDTKIVEAFAKIGYEAVPVTDGDTPACQGRQECAGEQDASCCAAPQQQTCPSSSSSSCCGK